MVRILLDHGADRNMKNGYQDTPLESVSVQFDDVKEMYEYFDATLGPLGLKLDLEYIEQTRPKIAAMLR